MQPTDLPQWLPTTLKEVQERGWDELDVILFSGDAYIDHPSFGMPVIGRVLESMGLKVAIVPQPNWRDDLRDFKKLGKPRLFFGVSAGVMDSMVNHYTAGRRLRSNDAYTPGNKAGFRPDYPTIVYSKILKNLFPDVPIVAGGVEASLRRVTHYDYWQNKLLPSMIVMSQADLIVYGMGEKPLMQVVDLLLRGVPFKKINTVQQTVFKVSSRDQIPVNKKWETFELNSHESCLEDKVAYAKNFRVIEVESNRMNAKRLVQKSGDEYVVINPAIPWLEEKEIDFAFDLPYTRLPHFKYKFKGSIPAYEMIKFSVNMHRGCFGGCSFCTISAHQGKFISSRSERSILEEVKKVAQLPDFKGHISDLGGPSANMYKMQGRDLGQCALCKRPSCIYPTVCTNLEADHGPMLDLYKKVDEVPGIKKVTIGSGIRYDLLLPERNKNGGKSMDEYIRTIAQKHVSGRLKIAPEHTAKDVLTLMRKPPFALYDLFQKKFMKASQDAGLKQQIIPYFISSHPGCTEADMAQLAVDTKDAGFQLEQVQDFTPTPMTNATVMYYSGINPDNMKPVYSAKTAEEKKAQNMFFFWYKPEFKQLIQTRLMKLKRPDLASRLSDKKR
ncbi:MAG: YgiQ family radical SAM protein [Bacteroidetes bacterium CG18_big_fil_WC_8_21_14_2_50_41_14]|nr:MAG: YgiQ family radical SAM protein [Bacteroidetes bacterium CG18_big_fil_WC_8_21_14_2_50_41_14]PJB55091.1 MAG: YgiQ family radical SAM protein [Bacteroidetes bacterium CG_4_9_14_3_um_filter_41_19]